MSYYNYLDFNPLHIYSTISEKGGVFFFVFWLLLFCFFCLLLTGHCFGCFSKDPEADKKENQVIISAEFCLFGYVLLKLMLMGHMTLCLEIS